MNFFLFIGAVNAFLAVALGAFGAHGLQGKIPSEMLAIYNTAAHYQLIHAVATAAVAMAPGGAAGGPFRWACILFTLGSVLFSGSLYVYATTGSTSVVAATPIGGLCFLAGWAMLAWAAFK